MNFVHFRWQKYCRSFQSVSISIQCFEVWEPKTLIQDQNTELLSQLTFRLSVWLQQRGDPSIPIPIKHYVRAQTFALDVSLGMVVFQPTLLLQGLYRVEATLVLLKIFCPCIYSTSHPPAILLRFLSLQRSHTTWWWSGTMLPLMPFICCPKGLKIHAWIKQALPAWW